MRIGRSEGETRISYATPERIAVRGKDLCRDLLGRIGFSAYFHLLVTGREPNEVEQVLLDAVLVAIAEHGFVPNVVASRLTYAADPGNLQGAVAAGLLGCGSVVLGTAEIAARLIEQGLKEVGTQSGGADAVASAIVESHREQGRRLPGFGHPLHRPVDPRALRLLELAEQHGAAGRAVDFARALDRAVRASSTKAVPMNVSLAIPAVLLDIGFPVAAMRGVPLLARTASLIAHLVEEADHPTGFQMAHHAEESIPYTGPRLPDSNASDI